MTTKYPPGGVLYPNTNKVNERAPDFRGNMEFDLPMLQEMQRLLGGKEKAQMELAGWRKRNAKGEFISLKMSTPYKPTDNEQEQGQPPSGPVPKIDDEIPF